MSDILLTKEEMDIAYNLGDHSQDRFCHDAVAQAQTKKIVEWGDQLCLNPPHRLGTPKPRWDCYDCMQELHKVAGMEVAEID